MGGSDEIGMGISGPEPELPLWAKIATVAALMLSGLGILILVVPVNFWSRLSRGASLLLN